MRAPSSSNGEVNKLERKRVSVGDVRMVRELVAKKNRARRRYRGRKTHGSLAGFPYRQLLLL